MSKETKFLDYNTLIRDNLLNVVKHALSKTADYGLTDGHHFYITFNTKFKDNVMPSYLTKDYPYYVNSNNLNGSVSWLSSLNKLTFLNINHNRFTLASINNDFFLKKSINYT